MRLTQTLPSAIFLSIPMKTRGRIKPSKPVSAIALVVGLVFTGIGVFMAIPNAGWFGVFWTLLALAATVYHAANLFSDSGIAEEVVDFESFPPSDSRRPAGESVEARLRQLDKLKGGRLITEAEYQQRRSKILDEL
jgi:hypothetical protein